MGRGYRSISASFCSTIIGATENINTIDDYRPKIVRIIVFWKRCFLKTSVSNGIIYTKYTQNPHIIEPPFNIATQSATYTVTACVSRWEPNVLNANNPCPAARQKQYWYFISLLRFSALKPTVRKTLLCLKT